MVCFPSALLFLLAVVAGVCGSRVHVSERARPMMVPPVKLPPGRAAPQRPAPGPGSAGVVGRTTRPAVTRAAPGVITAGPGALPIEMGDGSRVAEMKLSKILDGLSSSKARERFSFPLSRDESVAPLLDALEAVGPAAASQGLQPMVGEWHLACSEELPAAVREGMTELGEEKIARLSMVLSIGLSGTAVTTAFIELHGRGKKIISMYGRVEDLGGTPHFTLTDDAGNRNSVEVTYVSKGQDLMIMRTVSLDDDILVNFLDANGLRPLAAKTHVWRKIVQPLTRTPPISIREMARTASRTRLSAVREEAAAGSGDTPPGFVLASLLFVMAAGGTAAASSFGPFRQRSARKERGGLAAAGSPDPRISGRPATFAGLRQQPRRLRAARAATAGEDCVPLTGSTLQAALKMRCDVSGAGYAIYWANRNGEMVVAGDYVTDECKRELYALGLKNSFASQSVPFCSDVSGDGPVATVWRTKEPVFVKDVASSSIARKELAAKYAVTQICFAPIEAGVLEFGTSDGPLTATWEEMPECALINKAALSRGFESLGASYAMFWVQEGEKYKVAADYVSEERREELKVMRGDDLTMCSMSKDMTIDADGVNPISFAADVGEEMAVLDTSILVRADLAKEFGIHRMHFVPSEAGVLEFGIPEGSFLTGDTLKASLKMTCEANGAAYALYWRLAGGDATVAGDYVSPEGNASSYVEKSKDLTLAPTSSGPFAKVHNTGDTMFIPVASDCETLERNELAGELGIESICLIPVPGGVLEYGTSSGQSSSGWDRVEDACKAIMPKAELNKAFAGGATYAIFWRKEGESYVACATYDCSGEGGKSYASESAAVVIQSDGNSPVASAARAGIEVTVESPTVEADFERVTLATEYKIVRCHFVPSRYGVLEYGTGL